MTSDLLARLDGQALASGIFKDLPHAEPPLWADGQNIYFSDNSVQPIPAQFILTSSLTGVPIKGMRASIISGIKNLFYGVHNSLFRFDSSGGAVQVGSGYGDGNPNTNNLWSFERWSDWMLATNNLNTPQIYKGSSFADLTGISGRFTKLRFFLQFGEFMIGVDDNSIYWCSRGNVEQWVPSTSNSAGKITPQDLDGPFTGGVMLGSRALLFTLNSMHILSYIGPPTYFGCVKVQNSCGIYGINAISTQDTKAFGSGPEGFFVTDGNSHIFIDNGICRDDVFQNKNENALGKSLVWHSKFAKLINFWWPQKNEDENSAGWSFNYTNNTWAPRSDKRTAAEEQGIFPWGILGDASGGIYAESNVDDPTSVQDPSILITETGTSTMGFGWSGFGQGGFGGTLQLSA